MKKVLIGCGVVVVLGLIVVGGFTWWGIHKASGLIHSGEKMAAQMKAQQNEMAALNKEFPFQAPPKGQPLQLQADRLQAYLAVREAALPIFQDFEKKSKSFDAQYNDKKNAGALDAIHGAAKGMSMIADLTAQLRASYAKSLTAQKMSPNEFDAITGAIYATAMGAAQVGQSEMAKKQVAAIDAQIKSATNPQVKQMLEKEKATFEQMAANAPDPKTKAIFEANAKLTAQYKDRIQKAGNPAFDMFVMNGDDNFEKQMQAGLGRNANAQ